MFKNLKIILCLTLFVIILPCSSVSAENKNLDEITERFNQSVDLRGSIFLAIYDKFGQNLRMSAIFDACNKKALSKAFEPNYDEIKEAIAEKFAVLRLTGKLKFSDDRALFDSLLSTSMYIQGYTAGIKEAAKIFANKNICEAFEANSDKLLLQMKQSNKEKQ